MGIKEQHIAIIAYEKSARAAEITGIDTRIRDLKEQFGGENPEYKKIAESLITERRKLSKQQLSDRFEIARIIRFA